MPVKRTTRRLPTPRNINWSASPAASFSGTITELTARLQKVVPTHLEDYLNRAWVGEEFKSLDHALTKLENGDSKLLAKYKALEKSITAPAPQLTKYLQPDNEGLYLDIPTFLQGLPECWLNEFEQEDTGKATDIFINVGVHQHVKIETVFAKLVNVVQFIDNAEARGQRLNIYIGTYSKSTSDNPIKEKTHMIVKVKDESEPINLQQLVYLVATPVLVRFAFIYLRSESQGHLAGSSQADNDKEEELINDPDKIYIPSFYHDHYNGITNYTDLTTIYPHLKSKL